MVCFPNAKINIGLNITSKRDDGFHNIETIFYPIQLTDILEFVPSKSGNTTINTSGIALEISAADNICLKAYKLLEAEFQLPPLDIHLHKIIPSGAGLGGGSSDAAFFLKELNSFFHLKLTDNKLEEIALKLGSDCAFFIRNKPVFASGRGEVFEEITIDLSNHYIYLVKPEIFVSTADAYAGVHPKKSSESVKSMIMLSINEWKQSINNDFEESIFFKYPLLKKIKADLYKQGAIYASMSGSGSSIYGIFNEKPSPNKEFDSHFNWISKL